MKTNNLTDTIIALSTATGRGAIAVIRLSGAEAIPQTQAVFRGKNLLEQPSHTVHFGTIKDGETIIDEVVVTLFRAPNSFTKEDVVEISCHGSPFIVQKIIQLFIKKGVRTAQAGEFTKRAFLNGRFDLAQAEAVADLINSESEAAHQSAMKQMRGGFSLILKDLRQRLIHFASMIELELDFGEEDVEFADRNELKDLVNEILSTIRQLIDSFSWGNVIKNGIPTVIAGKPNAGKSTLLNALLNEEKAIVSEIAGTTRDFIEDELTIEGIAFRFVDTAGLRQTEDKIEAIGVERARKKMQEASLILYLIDLQMISSLADYETEYAEIQALGIPHLIVGNKIDSTKTETLHFLENRSEIVFISALNKENIELLKEKIMTLFRTDQLKAGDTVVTNMRHYESLLRTQESLTAVITGLDSGVTGDFVAMDIRHALYELGTITGEISTEDLLGNIFSKFCIGK